MTTRDIVNVMTIRFRPAGFPVLAAMLLLLAAGWSFALGSGETGSTAAMEGPGMKNPAAGQVGEKTIPETAETAVLAGGCFWGVEAVFERLDGVYDVVSGYSGGSAETAEYRMVGSGTTGHAESVRVVFDPARISYRTLLQVFFSVAHDPTQLNYQGPDVGTQYRSAVFYADEKQRAAAREYLAELEAAKVHKAPIVTELAPLEAFYPAEEYHQDFMLNNPNHPYIVYWDQPKIVHLEKEFPQLLASK